MQHLESSGTPVLYIGRTVLVCASTEIVMRFKVCLPRCLNVQFAYRTVLQ
jgi:hypothetical protein